MSFVQLKDTKEEMVQTIAAGRYMIVLMGLFAVYAGFMYNDFFSLGLDIFGTRYERSHQQGNTIYVCLHMLCSVFIVFFVLPLSTNLRKAVVRIHLALILHGRVPQMNFFSLIHSR